MTEPTTGRLTPLERLLRVVTDVRSGEARASLTLALNVFLLLTAYYIIKPVREALILAMDSGAEYKSYMSAVIALSLLVAVPLYARFVDKLSRLRLVVSVTLFFASHLVLFYFASRFESLRTNIGLVFFVWVGIFNMMVVAQLWSFANDLFDEEQGKRLFPLVALGASLGAAFGSGITTLLVGPLGVWRLLLVGAGLLVVCSALFVASERTSAGLRSARKEAKPALAAAPPGDRAEARRPEGAFALVLRHRYLLAIAMFTLIFNWANTNGEYMLGKLVKAAAAEAVRNGSLGSANVGDFIGRAYGEFNFAMTLLTVLFQSFVVSRVVKYGGVGVGLLVLPVITLVSGIAVFVVPMMAVLRIGKTLENATDYSLNNTVRQMLWLPTSYAMKFKAKQAVDTFFVRLGDVSSGLLVYIGAGLLAWSVRAFALANVLLVGAWIFFVWRIRREGERLERARAGDGESAEGALAVSAGAAASRAAAG